MRIAVLAGAAIAALPWSIAIAAPAHADAPPPPYIDQTQWVHWADLSEVLADAPDADLPGMRDQFVCHWEVAEAAEPGKTSWNLEPWRPVVSMTKMLEAACNPGGIQEPF